MADNWRTRVEFGSCNIGDFVEGFGIIKSFGRSWEADEPDYKKWSGTRYQETCDCCGKYAIEIENNTDCCDKCFPYRVRATFCYAYF